MKQFTITTINNRDKLEFAKDTTAIDIVKTCLRVSFSLLKTAGYSNLKTKRFFLKELKINVRKNFYYTER